MSIRPSLVKNPNTTPCAPRLSPFCIHQCGAKLVLRVIESAGTRPNHRHHRDLHLLKHRFEKSHRRSESANFQSTAQFQPIGAGGDGCHRIGDAADAHFNQRSRGIGKSLGVRSSTRSDSRRPRSAESSVRAWRSLDQHMHGTCAVARRKVDGKSIRLRPMTFHPRVCHQSKLPPCPPARQRPAARRIFVRPRAA